MSFRGTRYGQAALLCDQQILEQAMRAGGASSVAAALNKLKGDPPHESETIDVDGGTAQDRAEDLEQDEWEWGLAEWPEPLIGGQAYEMKTALIGGARALDMLNDGKIFSAHVFAQPVSPTHLTLRFCALSSEASATNCRTAVCPKILDLLTGNRKGGWECAGLADGSCTPQRHCKGGLDCDEEFCHLLHPSEDSH